MTKIRLMLTDTRRGKANHFTRHSPLFPHKNQTPAYSGFPTYTCSEVPMLMSSVTRRAEP